MQPIGPQQKSTTRSSSGKRTSAADARWNWWITHHGFHIAGALIALALATLTFQYLSDRQDSPGESPRGTTVTTQAGTSVTLPKLSGDPSVADPAISAPGNPSPRRIVQRSKLVVPPDWTNVLVEDW